ncbi:MAG: MBL fold metallo-hydrolase [Pirellulaceae bacterium]|nr:MBL fold metallo-hydrolase [Pirellulaceae bacterium]
MLIQNPPVAITDRLWMLGTTEYPVYLFRGSQYATLFEGGIGPLAAVLRQQLADLGIAGDSIRQLIVTHAHPDHVMAVPAMRELCPGIQVIASETAARTLSVEKAVAFFAKMDDALTDSLVAQGLVAESQRRAPLAENRIAIDRPVREGDTIEVDDGVAFQVLQTPGHSDCSLSFYEPQAKLLIVSDATGYYMPAHGDWWPNYFAGYGPYVQSIERLAAIDAEVLGLSHNGAIRGAEAVGEYFRGVLASTRAYHQRIVDAAKSGRTVREVAEELGREIHDKAPLMPVDFFQKNCAILIKASLQHEGIEAPAA